jgi:hypothetical protein
MDEFEDFQSRRSKALKYCEKHLDWYGKARDRNRTAFQISQGMALTLSGLTPVLILWSDLPKTIQALPAALAAILTGLNGIFHWRDNYIIFAYTWNNLANEKIKYVTRATEDYGLKVDKENALSNFVSNIDKHIVNEVQEWRAIRNKENPN